MKSYHLVFFAMAASLASLTSCELPAYEITPQEAFTRGFIKEFGLIDPAQDWNLAKAEVIKVTTPQKVNSLKLYSKTGNKYYLVADLHNVEGTIEVPVDVPEGTTDILAKADGTFTPGKIGAELMLNPAQSRGIPNPDEATPAPSTISTTHNGITVTASLGDWMYFNAQQIAPITADYVWNDYYSIRNSGTSDSPVLDYTYRENPMRTYDLNLGSQDMLYGEDVTGWGLLPELNEDHPIGTVVGNSNVKLSGNKVVAVNFTVDPGNNTLTIYPMYWNTSRTHTLGIYFLDKDENALDANGNIATSAAAIARFPIYVDKGKNDIEMTIRQHVEAGEPFVMLVPNWHSLPSAFQSYLNNLTLAEYNTITGKTETDNNAFTARMAAYAAITSNSGAGGQDALDEIAALFMAWYNAGTGVSFDSNHQLCDSGWHNYTNFYSPAQYRINSITIDQVNNDKIYWKITFQERGDSDDEIPNEIVYESSASWIPAAKTELSSSDDHDTSKEENAGYYTHLPLLMRSRGIDVNLGTYTGKIGMYIKSGSDLYFSQQKYNIVGNMETPYAVSYKHPMSDRTYFSFEDWPGGNSDYDFNDLIFLVTNVAKVENDEVKITGNDPDEFDDYELVEDGYRWLIAAEDLGATDDFDFNDVVFTVSKVTETKNYYMTDENGDWLLDESGNRIPSTLTTPNSVTGTQPVVKVQALAAGGILEVYLHYYNGTTDYILGPGGYIEASSASSAYEWHRWFGTSSLTMINTRGYNVRGMSSCDISAIVPDSFTMAEFSKSVANGKIEGFYISVGGTSGSLGTLGGNTTNEEGRVYIIGASDTGAAPQMFLIPDIGHLDAASATNSAANSGWHWPYERTHIADAYPQFADWVSDASSAPNWYQHKGSGAVTRINP